MWLPQAEAFVMGESCWAACTIRTYVCPEEESDQRKGGCLDLAQGERAQNPKDLANVICYSPPPPVWAIINGTGRVFFTDALQ